MWPNTLNPLGMGLPIPIIHHCVWPRQFLINLDLFVCKIDLYLFPKMPYEQDSIFLEDVIPFAPLSPYWISGLTDWWLAWPRRYFHTFCILVTNAPAHFPFTVGCIPCNVSSSSSFLSFRTEQLSFYTSQPSLVNCKVYLSFHGTDH